MATESPEYESDAVAGLVRAHEISSRRAIAGFRLGLNLVGRRGLSKDELRGFVDRLQDDYEALWDRRVRALAGKVLGPQYRISREAYWRAALDGEERRSNGIDYLEGRNDLDAISTLENLHGGLVATQPKRLKVRSVITDALVGWYDEQESVDGISARTALTPLARQLYGLAPGPTAWPGSQTALWSVTGAAMTVAARTAGHYRAALDLGTRGRWVTAEDELVCPRCGVMHGIAISMDALRVHADGIAARPSWIPEPEFVDIYHEAQGQPDPSLYMAQVGVGLPPLHGLCRCRVEPEGEPLFADGTDVAKQARRLMGLRMAGPAAEGLDARRRGAVADAYGAFAAWGERFSAPLVIRDGEIAFSDGQIEIDSASLAASSDSSTRNDVAYMLGRAFYEMLSSTWRAEWEARAPRVSPSSNRSGAEAFAQAVELWVEDPQDLRRRAPEAHRVLAGLLSQRRALLPDSGVGVVEIPMPDATAPYEALRAWSLR